MAGQSPSRQTFSYYRALRERWMRESRYYFFCHTPKKWGYGTPTPKSGGYAYPRTRRKLRLCNMIGYWHHPVVRLSVCPSVRMSVCDAVHCYLPGYLPGAVPTRLEER